MAANTNPIFVLTPNVGVGRITTGITTRDTSVSTPTTIFTPGANGSLLNEIRVKSETDLADSVVIIWLKVGGSTWYLFDEFDVGDPAAGSTTVGAFSDFRTYRNLFLPSGCLVGATITVTPSTGGVNVFGFGGDY